MTASADIVTSQATGLTVPTQALRGNTVTLVRRRRPPRVHDRRGGRLDDPDHQRPEGRGQGRRDLDQRGRGRERGTGHAGTTQQRTQGLQGAGGGGFAGGGTGGPPAGGGSRAEGR